MSFCIVHVVQACAMLCHRPTFLHSLSHCRGLAKKDTIPLSSEFSFASCFQAWAEKPAFGLMEHRDDIFLTPRLSLGNRDMIERLCERAPPKRFEALADLQEVMEKLQCDRGDKGLTTDISRSMQCKICEAPVPRVCMRTQVGQHLLRKECVKGQEEISLATTCGVCGDRVTCSTQVVRRNKRTHALVTLMISDYPSQPLKLRWNTLAKK